MVMGFFKKAAVVTAVASTVSGCVSLGTSGGPVGMSRTSAVDGKCTLRNGFSVNAVAAGVSVQNERYDKGCAMDSGAIALIKTGDKMAVATGAVILSRRDAGVDKAVSAVRDAALQDAQTVKCKVVSNNGGKMKAVCDGAALVMGN